MTAARPLGALRLALAPSLRWLIFQLHWMLGITIGIVLAIMGVTGATMAFEDQIMEALSRGVIDVAPRAAPVLSPDQVLARFALQAPGAKPTSITLRSVPGAAPQVTYRPPKTGPEASAQKRYLDPYDGKILGQARGETFFATVRQIHRYLLLPDEGKGWGRQITGVAAFSLIYFAISGIYLRWPKRALDWKVWLKPNLKLRKRGLYWSLHSVIGTWAFLVYLTIALTGLTWSYDWYKAGFNRVLTGRDPKPAASEVQLDKSKPSQAVGAKSAKPKAAPRLDLAWNAARRVTPDVTTMIITVPKPGAPIRVRALPGHAAHERAFDELKIDGKTGAVLSRDAYADMSLGEKIVSARLAVHRGAFFGLPGAILFMLAAVTMPLFPITGYLLYFGRRRAKAAAAARAPRQQPSPTP
jgi:sulfite reductase (NADPH) flavoprotein alpha-component